MVLTFLLTNDFWHLLGGITMDFELSAWVDRRRIILGVLLLRTMASLVALGAVGKFGGEIGTSHQWGMAVAYNLIAPRIDIIFVGRFEGAPTSVNVPVHWEPTENNSGLFVPRLAEFRIDDVVKGPQELTGKLISVRYAVVDYGTDGGPSRDPNEPLGLRPYRPHDNRCWPPLPPAPQEDKGRSGGLPACL